MVGSPVLLHLHKLYLTLILTPNTNANPNPNPTKPYHLTVYGVHGHMVGFTVSTGTAKLYVVRN